jgi:hypothetical protein
VRAVQAGRRGAAEKDAEAAFAAAPGVLDLVVVVAHVDFGVVEDCYWGFGLSGVREVCDVVVLFILIADDPSLEQNIVNPGRPYISRQAQEHSAVTGYPQHHSLDITAQ